MPRASVDLVNLGDDFASLAVRSVLEAWDIRVALHLMATAQQLVDLLGGSTPLSPVIVLMGHGVADGIALPPLAPEVEARQPFHAVVTPADVARHFHLPRATVISTACSTGSAGFREAFRAAGATHYLAPDGDPPGPLALMVTLTCCYAYLVRAVPMAEAVLRARTIDPEAMMFVLS